MVAVLGGRRVDALLPGRLGRILFVYLVVNRTRDVLSDELVDALWPVDPPGGADGTLRTLVSRVRGAVGSDTLGRGGRYRLDLPADVHVDFEAALDAIHRAETAIASEEWRRAWGPAQVALFTARRGFLPGDEAPWIDDRRRILSEVELRALECYVAASLGVGGRELPDAERAARRLVEREPFRESGHRLLMRVLAERGNVADALRVYQSLAVLLRDELGVDPSPATKELHTSLLAIE